MRGDGDLDPMVEEDFGPLRETKSTQEAGDLLDRPRDHLGEGEGER